MKMIRQIISCYAPVCIALLTAIGTAYGHVTVQPKQSAPGANVRYTMKVPTEKFVPTVRVEVEFPSSLDVMALEPKPQWKVEEKKDSAGKFIGMTLIGSIPTGESSEFNFTARNRYCLAKPHGNLPPAALSCKIDLPTAKETVYASYGEMRKAEQGIARLGRAAF